MHKYRREESMYEGPKTAALIRMLVLGQIHNLPVNIQFRQFGPGVFGPRVDEPPHYGQNEHAD